MLGEETISKHVNEYKERGKLKPENGGSLSKLGEEESLKLIEHLEEKTYMYVYEICSYVKCELRARFR